MTSSKMNEAFLSVKGVHLSGQRSNLILNFIPSPQSPPLLGESPEATIKEGEGITFLSPGGRGKGEGVRFYL
jgi:hypothetical protein